MSGGIFYHQQARTALTWLPAALAPPGMTASSIITDRLNSTMRVFVLPLLLHSSICVDVDPQDIIPPAPREQFCIRALSGIPAANNSSLNSFQIAADPIFLGLTSEPDSVPGTTQAFRGKLLNPKKVVLLRKIPPSCSLHQSSQPPRANLIEHSMTVHPSSLSHKLS